MYKALKHSLTSFTKSCFIASVQKMAVATTDISTLCEITQDNLLNRKRLTFPQIAANADMNVLVSSYTGCYSVRLELMSLFFMSLY